MASIDKIYMSEDEGREFWNWILTHNEECKLQTGSYLSGSFWKTEDGYSTNYSESVDSYLWENCDLQFIQDRLKGQYPDEEPENDFENMLEYLLTLTNDDFSKVKEILDFGDKYNFTAGRWLWEVERQEKEDQKENES